MWRSGWRWRYFPGSVFSLALPFHQQQQQNQQQKQLQQKIQQHKVDFKQFDRNLQGEKQDENQEQQQEEKQVKNEHHAFRQHQLQVEQQNIPKIQMVFSLDYTDSSEDLHVSRSNPYAKVIEIMGEVVENIPGADDFISFSFGRGFIRPICNKHECASFRVFHSRYLDDRKMVGGTGSEARSSIERAMEICQESQRYTVLVVITDGQLTSMDSVLQKTQLLPLSIIFVLVKDIEEETFRNYETRYNNVGVIGYASQASQIQSRWTFSDTRLRQWMAAQYAAIIARQYPFVVKRMKSLST